MDQSFALRKGAWTAEEDMLLRQCIEKYRVKNWRHVPLRAGLRRCPKSCRLRWVNYLNPNIKRGNFTHDEIDLLLRLHKLLGNRWSLIAGRLSGRTDNEIKNFWYSHMSHINRKAAGITASKREKVAALNPINQKNEILKPKPRTFPKCSPWLSRNSSSSTSRDSSATNAVTTCNDSRARVGMKCPFLPSAPAESTTMRRGRGCKSFQPKEVETVSLISKKNKVFKPQPRTLPKSSPWLSKRSSSSSSLGSLATNVVTTYGDSRATLDMECPIILPTTQGSTMLEQESNSSDKELEKGESSYIDKFTEDEIRSLWVEDDLQSMLQVGNETSLKETNICWDDDLSLDFNLWDLPIEW